MNLKPVLWIVVGMVVGAAGALAAATTASPQQKPAEVSRLHYIAAGVTYPNGPSAAFYKDAKSGGCWLAINWTAADMSLAVAPKEACD
jgi:tryptophan synthase beta subunit